MINDMLSWNDPDSQRYAPSIYRELIATLGLAVNDQHRVATELERRRFFANYLATCIEQGVMDIIHVHFLAWMFLMALFSIACQCYRYLFWTLDELTPMILCIFSLWVTAMYVEYKRKE